MTNHRAMSLYSKTIHVKYKGYDIYAIQVDNKTTIQRIRYKEKTIFDHAVQKFEDVKHKLPFTKVGVSKFF